MNKSQAIRLKCLECAGDSHKEVTLCHLVDCPLWTFRFGYSMKDKRYKRRMKIAKEKYRVELKDIAKIDKKASNLLLKGIY